MKIQELSSSKKELDTIQRQQNVTSEELRLARLKLKDVKTSFESQKNRGRVLEAIMKQKELGTIPGVHGRLVN
jgi:chromosome segregation ATPase